MVLGREEVDTAVAERVHDRTATAAGFIAVHLRFRAREQIAMEEVLKAAQYLLLAATGQHGGDERYNFRRRDEAMARDDFEDLLITLSNLKIRQRVRPADKPRQALRWGDGWRH